MGGDKSPHRIFAAALTKDPTASELHRGEPKVLSVHFIDNLKSTPPFSFYQGNDFTGPTTWLPGVMGTLNVALLRKGPQKESI